MKMYQRCRETFSIFFDSNMWHSDGKDQYCQRCRVDPEREKEEEDGYYYLRGV